MTEKVIHLVYTKNYEEGEICGECDILRMVSIMAAEVPLYKCKKCGTEFDASQWPAYYIVEEE